MKSQLIGIQILLNSVLGVNLMAQTDLVHIQSFLKVDSLEILEQNHMIVVVDTTTKYLAKMPLIIEVGDVKQGFQSGDHNGWVLLDGRDISTLSINQQNQATYLGFIDNIPDATNSYLSQNQEDLGSVTGSNQVTISQDQLPDVTLTTTTSGNHKHSIRTALNDTNGPASQGYPFGNNHRSFRTTDRNQTTVIGGINELVLEGGAHTHTTSSINGGVIQQTLPILPKTLSVNVFVYLGE